ncbi:PRC-barrel domain-containing protein [Halosolutus gelatinilyticus]|uniref:PRC-barrel domain-containing protein n=1 Tax=Halosolutus gelatinilyticus TaxID=2931975 RepID=UPI001FF35BE1|nr:PRC-barrel domain-containing protein [Halosolutus gelatinilyticus]
MSEILARDLVGKFVVGNDGTIIGRLHNVTVIPKSGALRDLVVEPDGQSSATGRSDGDRLRIPVDRIETVADQIIVRNDE